MKVTMGFVLANNKARFSTNLNKFIRSSAPAEKTTYLGISKQDKTKQNFLQST